MVRSDHSESNRGNMRREHTGIGILRALDVIARLLARVGLHQVNSIGRRIVERVILDRLSATANGIVLSGRFCHRGYLYGIERHACEPYMASVFAKVIEPGMVVIDVGAFIGYYTIMAGRGVGPTGTVFSFEPDPTNFSALKANVESNGTARWTVLVQGAAADSDGQLPFFVDRWDPTQSGVGKLRVGTRPVVVTAARLDATLQDVNHVDVVKIDTEGFEMAVLSGLETTVSRMRGRPMTMFVECFPEALRALGSSPEAMHKWLTNHGFSVGLIDEGRTCITLVGKADATYGNWFCTTSDAVWQAFVH